MRSWTSLFLLSGVGVAGVVGGLGSILGCHEAKTPPPALEKPRATVAVSAITAEDQRGMLVAIGRVKNVRESMVAAKAMGRVERIRVKAGDAVRKGALLAVIDSADARARLEQARGAYAQAQAAQKIAAQMLERFESLSEKDAASKAKYDQAVFDHQNAQGALTQAKGAVEQAEAYLAETKVIAPFEGRIVDTMIEEGEMANPGMPLLRMESSGALEFEATMSAQDIFQISVGMPVTVVLDAQRDEQKSIMGKVTEIVPASDALTHTSLVRIGLGEADWIRSGMFGRAQFEGVRLASSGGIYIDSARVVSRGQLDGVFIVDGTNRVRLRLVRTGKKVGTKTEILAGLDVSDRLVVSSIEGLIDGQPAEVRP